MLLAACGSDEQSSTARRPADWTEAAHGKEVAPNYEVVFGSSAVHTLELQIEPADFQAMQADLADIIGSGPGGDMFPGGAGQVPIDTSAACAGRTEGAACEISAPFGVVQGTCTLTNAALSCAVDMHAGPGAPPAGSPGGPGSGGVDLLGRDPIYVPVEVRYDGHAWTGVGMRYKGNSSLAAGYAAKNGKLPFRLDFDEFEAERPELEDQRFYGFKTLTFSSNWSDDSQLRETYVSELLRDRGIPAARCAFYRVVVDVGNGPQYWGLYTAIEDPSDDAMLDAQFGDSKGNLYKPEGDGADWTRFVQEGFEKKTNEEEADWSDVRAAITALHADPSDAARWRSGLEATFDVELFLTWLAVNTTIVNWDSYGSMAHNYYLYAPATDPRLQWIPWDHNLSMTSGGPGQSPNVATDVRAEMFHTNVSSTWPLIEKLLKDDVYLALYRQKLSSASQGLFEVDAATQRLRELHELIRPHVVGPTGERAGYTTVTSEDAFLASLDGEQGLIAHIRTRHGRVKAALAAE